MDDMLESKTNSVGTGKDEGFGSNPVAVEDPQNIPKALEPTEYKLLRFSDFDVSINRIYCYRVRLALEDPNYTRSKNLSPRTADLKPEAVTRVQALETSDGEAMNNLEAGVKFVRNSKRYTPWSQASTPIATRQPIELYSSQTIGTWTQMKTPNGKSDVVVESLPTMTKIVYAEWSQDLAMLIPRKTEVQRGALLSGTATEGLDAIHPISKAIKWVAGFKFSNPVTVVDIRGGLPLAASRKNEKDLLASGGEVVAFDPRTGELIISREFETLTQYQMLGFTDETSQ